MACKDQSVERYTTREHVENILWKVDIKNTVKTKSRKKLGNKLEGFCKTRAAIGVWLCCDMDTVDSFSVILVTNCN